MQTAGVCVMLLLTFVACGGRAIGGDVCGPGTHDDNGECVPDEAPDATTVVCGPGTTRVGNECLPTSTNGDAGTSDVDAADDSAPPSIDVSTACLVSDDKFVIAGNDYIHSGPPLVIEGGTGWYAGVSSMVNGEPSYVTIDIGFNWHAEFSTKSIGVPLSPGTYANAQRAAFTDPNHPGLDVSGDGAGCNMISGQFTVIDMSTAADASTTITSFTVTFEQHCEQGTNYNVGCIHFTQ
jgi:hypothetical protein